jgi:hypothetical protein
MKKKDFTLIAIIIVVSGMLSFVLSNILFSSPKNRQEKVEVVTKITPDFMVPDNKYFNADSINPTQIIRIGEDPNNTPFNQKN